MNTPLRVLIVEDSEDDAELMLRELRRGGYAPAARRVQTAEEMTEALRDGPWHLVLSDYTLPHFSAPEALRILTASGLDVPFIIISGTIGEERAVASMKAGAHGFIAKDHLARLVPAIERELREAAGRAGRREAERALREERDFIAAVLQTSGALVLVLDTEGRVVRFNRAAEIKLGHTAAEAMGRPYWDLFLPAGDVEEGKAAFRALVAGLYPSQREAAWITRDGRRLLIAWACTALLDGSGAVRFIVAAGIDITEHKRAEEALHLAEAQLRQAQKMEAVGRLAGGVAHDFNNLLLVILGHCQMLRDGLPAESPLRAAAEEIQGAADRAAAVTRQLLILGRKQVMEPRVVDLNTVVADLHKMLRRLIGEDIDLVILADPAPARVRVDQGQIEQVILNLVVNARDAMPKGGRLTLETSVVELDEEHCRRHVGARPGPHVRLSVSDTGTGMDAETQAHLFEPFFTTKGVGKGTGLGLSTAHGIVSRSGGHIWAASTPGKGSVFRVCLPRVETPVAVAAADTERPGPLRGTETILLVEDEAPVRSLMRQILERHGYRLLEAEDARRAVEIGRTHSAPIHLLLTDVVMPGPSGPELAARLQSTLPNLRVLLVSGYTDSPLVADWPMIAEGAFLQKPFTPDILLQKVREVLDKPRPARPNLRRPSTDAPLLC